MEETVAAIGFFDGIHKGHQNVIETAKEIAKRENRKSAVITFSPHPSVVLKKQKKPIHYLTPFTEKKAILEDMGIDVLYIITFNKVLSQLSASEFVSDFIVGLHIKHLVAGFDFTYGYMGKGTITTLKEDAKGKFAVTTIDKLEDEGEKVSSTWIRQLLIDGEVKKINDLLNRPYQTSGIVVQGEKRGRTIGFPTANIAVEADYALPKVGVYAIRASISNQEKVTGMANVGYKPTFHEDNQIDHPTIEVHLFDFEQDIYGKSVRIEWIDFIRDEVKFNGVDQLIDQLKKDEQQIRHLFTTIDD
nr:MULTISPECIES: bifunctional riboflavin kinase/FAD synthetase [Paraliobacillus]